jgi:hypothetical protein
MSSTYTDDRRYNRELSTSAHADNALTSDNWRGERSVLVPALLVGAIASIGMAFIERMF